MEWSRFKPTIQCAALFIACVCASAQAQTPNKNASGPSEAQQSPPSPEITNARRIRAVRVTETIKIDGRLDESAWSQAAPATDFRQEEPTEGAPASERTEGRVLFDDKNLYVGIHAFDSEPARINSRELVRDASFSNDDKVELLFDTYHDRRNAFRFAVGERAADSIAPKDAWNKR